MISLIPLKREYLIRSVAVTGIIILCTLAILNIENLLLSFVLAFVLNYLFSPFANAFERKGISRRAGVSGIFIITGFIIGVFLWKELPDVSAQIRSLKNEIPKYTAGVTLLFANFESGLNKIFPDLLNVDISKNAEALLINSSSQFFTNLPKIISTSLSVMLLAPLLAFFMLIDGQTAVKKLLTIVPNPLFETALNLQHQINIQIGGFVRARLLEAAIVGIVVWAGLVLIGFPYAIFIAVFAGLTNLIPYLGPVIGTVPAVLIAIINGGSGMEILSVAAVFGVAQVIDAVLIVPIVVAKIVNLHAVIVIVVIIFGAQIGGILGMIISIPVTSILKLTIITVYQHLIEYNHS